MSIAVYYSKHNCNLQHRNLWNSWSTHSVSAVNTHTDLALVKYVQCIWTFNTMLRISWVLKTLVTFDVAQWPWQTEWHMQMQMPDAVSRQDELYIKPKLMCRV